MRISAVVAALLCTVSAHAADTNLDRLSVQQRAGYLSAAKAWNAENLADPIGEVAKRDLLNGPAVKNGVKLVTGQEVRCSYVVPAAGKRVGSSPKFDCKTPEGIKFKVKYQQDGDGDEVWSEPIALRLAWALGFAGQRSWSVKVVCVDCPQNPWRNKGSRALRVFEPATVAVNYGKQKLYNENSEDGGWKWTEIDAAVGRGSTRAEIDALRLFSAFIHHSDLDTAQQRFVCADSGLVQTSPDVYDCRLPVLALHDVGQSFGGGGRTSMNLSSWQSQPLWKNGCRLAVKPMGGTQWWGDPTIGEAGRELLSRLLGQLSDAQIADLFRTGRIDQVRGFDRGLPLSSWVQAFKAKRAQVDAKRCN